MLRALLLSTVLIPLTLLAEEPPIDVEVFFSKDDKHWPDAEKKLTEVNKKFPRLRLKKVSIDDDAGYKELANREKEFNIKQRGDLVILLGPYPLISKGDNRLAENSFEAVVGRAIHPNSGKGRLKSDPAAFAKEVFGASASIEALGEMHDGQIGIKKVLNDGQLAGYVVDAYIPNRCPMCNDTQFLLAASVDLKITTIKTVHPIELYGVPMPPERAEKFLAQFKGRGPTEAPQEVDGITGATKTVSAYENAMVEIMNELKERTKK
jgi:hypothetical protein